jgi:hypothetical protein
MVDRLLHHAEVVRLKGDSYRLKDRTWGRCLPTMWRDEGTVAGEMPPKETRMVATVCWGLGPR